MRVTFPRKIDAQKWLDGVTASVVAGTYVDPTTARTTVGDWCDTWLAGYASRAPSTVRQAKVHLHLIKAGVRADAAFRGAALTRERVDGPAQG